MSPIPANIFEPKASFFYADTVYARLQEHIDAAQHAAGSDQVVEVDLLLPNGAALRVTQLGFYNPNLIVVHGQLPSGATAEMLVSHTALHVQIVTGPRYGSDSAKPAIGYLGSLGR